MKDESRIEETSYVKARAKRHPSPLIAILTIHILSFHIGVKLLRPKILSFTDGCWPFQRSKTVGWGEREGKERRRRIAAAGRRKTGGKRGEMTRDDAREPGTKEDSSKQQCLHSPAEENTFHDPKKPGHRCIHRLSSFFSFFFFTVTRSTRPTSKRCCVKIDDSMFEGVILEIVNIVQARSSAPCE